MLTEDKLAANPMNSLRPHHALCVLFFEGKGYSQVFIENMAAFVSDPSQLLTIATGCDTLCQACPHNQDGICDDEEKVAQFDRRVLRLGSKAFQTEQAKSLSELCQNVYVAILQQGLLKEVCGECEWAAFCHEKWQQADFNRQLLLSDSTNRHSF